MKIKKKQERDKKINRNGDSLDDRKLDLGPRASRAAWAG